MGIETDKLSAESITFRAACREDTGRHMLDSGGAYGRWHEKDEIDPKSPLVSLEFYGWEDDGYPTVGEYGPRGEILATLNTGAFLDINVGIDRELQAEFEAFSELEENRESDWFQCAHDFLESKGLVNVASDNTYNNESDLDQPYVWEVWVPEGDEGCDWIYADDFVSVYFMHTGCDVRGGYGRPIFSTERAGECAGDYVIPLDTVCEYYFHGIEREEGKINLLPGMPEALDAGEVFCERWNDHGRGSCGYSSYPIGEVMSFVTRCFPDTVLDGGVDVEVTFRARGDWDVEPGNGSAYDITERVRLYACAPYC